MQDSAYEICAILGKSKDGNAGDNGNAGNAGWCGSRFRLALKVLRFANFNDSKSFMEFIIYPAV